MMCPNCKNEIYNADGCPSCIRGLPKGSFSPMFPEDVSKIDWKTYFDQELETQEELEDLMRKVEMDKEKLSDKKYDQGKPMMHQMKKDFPDALLAVADVTRYGVEKYNAPGSWKKVTNALDRYEDALGRHDVQCCYEKRDEESGRLHAAHRAWNALATLQLIIEEEKKSKIEKPAMTADELNERYGHGGSYDRFLGTPDFF